MADEVKLGVAVVPVRVSLDELDQGLSQARTKIDSVMGGAWQKAGAGASGLQESVAGVTGSVSGLTDETVQATSAAADMGRELQTAAEGKGAPAVKGLVDQVGGLTRGLQQVMQIAGSAVALEGIRRVGEAWLDLGVSGSQFINVERSFQRLTESMGINSAQMLSDLTELSGGIMSQTELMKTYNIGVGLAGEAVASRFGEYIQLARAAAAQTGQSFEYMLNSAIVATGRLSTPIADNLTLTISASEAYEKYAATIGKSASDLTKFEQQEAFATEMLAQAEQKFGDLNEATANLAGDGIARLKASFEDLGNAAAMAAAPGIDQLADSVAGLAGILDGPTLQFLKLYSAQKQIVTSGEGAIGTFRTLASATNMLGPGTALILGMQVGVERLGQALMETAPAQWVIQGLVKAIDPLGMSLADVRNEQELMVRTGQRLTGALQGMGEGARSAQVDMKGLNSAIASGISLISNLSGAARDAQGSLQGMALDMRISMIKAQDFAKGIEKPQMEWFTTGKKMWELPQAFEDYQRALGTWVEGQGRKAWSDHEASIRSAGGAYGGLKDSMEDYYSSLASAASGILSPTQDFDLNALTEEVYGYQEKWDEPARRAMDVVKLGTDSPWAEQMGLGGKEDALQYIKDFYAGRLPEDVNWGAAVGQYQQQMEMGLGQQNLASLFEEKLLGSGWGPEGEALATLQSSFGPGGENAAASFADSFVEHDWEGMSLTASERIMAGLTTHLEQRQSRYSDTFERFIVATVERVFFGGAKP